MNSEIQSIRIHLRDVIEGSPWFGKSVYALLDEVEPGHSYEKPTPSSHSMLELLYHMNTWAGFTLKRIEKDPKMDLVTFEKLDWRPIDRSIHNWKDGVEEFKSIHTKILDLLESRDDDFLDETVEFRKYDFRFLLNGLIQHDIYHIAQIAYVNKSYS